MSQQLADLMISTATNNDVGAIPAIHNELLKSPMHSVIFSFDSLRASGSDNYTRFAQMIKDDRTLFKNNRDIYRRIIAYNTGRDFVNEQLSLIEHFVITPTDEPDTAR